MLAGAITPAGAQVAAAPNAGGYAGDNGSDFGVGRAVPKGGREAVVVGGVRGMANDKLAPWLGLRFADLLAHELRAPMRSAADSGGVARFLAARRIPAWQVRPTANAPLLSAANALHTWPEYRSYPLLVVGEISVRGKENSPDAVLRLRLRVLRWEKLKLRAACNDVLLSAPLGEWTQLPARASLALLDSLRVALIEDERISMLRNASPLQPRASAARLAAEKQLGQMQYEALQCHLLSQRINKETTSARVVRLRASSAFGSAARQKLAAWNKKKLPAEMAPLHATAAQWRAFVMSVSRDAAVRLQAASRAQR